MTKEKQKIIYSETQSVKCHRKYHAREVISSCKQKQDPKNQEIFANGKLSERAGRKASWLRPEGHCAALCYWMSLRAPSGAWQSQRIIFSKRFPRQCAHWLGMTAQDIRCCKTVGYAGAAAGISLSNGSKALAKSLLPKIERRTKLWQRRITQ